MRVVLNTLLPEPPRGSRSCLTSLGASSVTWSVAQRDLSAKRSAPDPGNRDPNFLLATELGDLQGAGSHFESALTITTAQPEQQAALVQTKIEIGLAQGNMQFSEWMLTGFGAMP